MRDTDRDNFVSLVTMANKLKRRSVELQAKIENVDETTLFVLEAKRKKFNKWNNSLSGWYILFIFGLNWSQAFMETVLDTITVDWSCPFCFILYWNEAKLTYEPRSIYFSSVSFTLASR